MINPAKLTDWISCEDQLPTHIGEYVASVLKCGILLRWWNGEYWSEPYAEPWTDLAKQHQRRKKAIVPTYAVFYKGLRAKPRVHSIHYLRPLK